MHRRRIWKVNNSLVITLPPDLLRDIHAGLGSYLLVKKLSPSALTLKRLSPPHAPAHHPDHSETQTP